MATLVVNICDASGQIMDMETIQVPDEPVSPVAAAVAQARAEVAGLSPTGATRQAVEALATAVEALTQT